MSRGGFDEGLDDGGGRRRTPPPNYLVQSILTLVCCCWPLAIPAIINAAKVNSAFASGDYAGAQAASASAKKWSTLSAICGVVLIVIGVILNVALTMMAK